ncbi:2-amino-4-hydroxy-6-hydroxymethyldihydropteridine diphosphokinase [Marinibacterium sp. SX1]|uniref:2-amino-4-hydroxy-6- hydroxymethyldihydropteridine diphosphokinase n=1 Tax=Marinibacterium sp. SX1 TaxID=3388424 RepID=UPI003D176DF9
MTDLGSSLIICLGANLPSQVGAPAETLRSAVAALAGKGFEIRAVSRFYATPCFPAGAGPDYVNAALSAWTCMSPDTVLAALHDIESDFGRNRKTRWGQRTLDLDLVAWGGLVLPDRAVHDTWRALPPDEQRLAAPDRLILPHPRIQDRAFVLVPMLDIAPGWRHPVLDKTVAGMLADLPQDDRDAVRPL